MQYVDGVAPKYLRSGKGCRVFDVDGNEYIDYCMGLHALILGYSYPVVNEAIARQLRDGTNLSLMHPLEVEVAELLKEVIPCAEMIRFGKNGADATGAAVRVARAYTSRDKICCCGYHGYHDWSISTTSRNRGVPKSVQELTVTFHYNDLDSLKKAFEDNSDEIAAVIMEPWGGTEPREGFLSEVKTVTHKNGAVLIFDEIITGFRLSLGGAQEFFSVIPDLAAFGKAMANGMPISALVGKAEIMREFESVFFSTTFGGETLSLAAAKATITEIRERKVIPYIWNVGRQLQEGYNKIAREHDLQSDGPSSACSGYAPRTTIAFKNPDGKESLEMKTLFQQELLKRGILYPGHNIMSFSHTPHDIEETLEAYDEALEILRRAIDEGNVNKYVEGKLLEPVFRESEY